MQDISEMILQTAGQLFRKYGVRSISMDDIARELSISKKTIYQFFKDKQEIVCITSKRFLDQQKEKFDRIESESENAIQKLYRATLHAREIFEKINPIILFEIKKYYKEAWDLYIDHEQNVMYDSLVNTLEEGIAGGLFRPDINVKILATLRMEEIKIAFDTDVFPEEEYNFQEVQFQILEHFFYGILTEEGNALLNSYKKNLVTNDQQ